MTKTTTTTTSARTTPVITSLLSQVFLLNNNISLSLSLSLSQMLASFIFSRKKGPSWQCQSSGCDLKNVLNFARVDILFLFFDLVDVLWVRTRRKMSLKNKKSCDKFSFSYSKSYPNFLVNFIHWLMVMGKMSFHFVWMSSSL